ncbi:SDR family NAD(P)-dependent oxidoreductase [Streptomyces sp. NPDC007896]|uniref:SDR family NAD(P)-dependent oxidoreductase n=1 Tax=Streptomyces sp. NPDC007896 TaxID=3364784 RepID=UPI0036EBA4CB
MPGARSGQRCRARDLGTDRGDEGLRLRRDARRQRARAVLPVAAFSPAMAAKGSGSVINTGSMVGSLGLATGAAHGATKAARRCP